MVYDATRQEINGVPFRLSERYVKTGEFSKLANGGACNRVQFHVPTNLPSGPLFFVTARTVQVAKTGFRLKFFESGALSELGIDTGPAATDTPRGSNDLITTALGRL